MQSQHGLGIGAQHVGVGVHELAAPCVSQAIWRCGAELRGELGRRTVAIDELEQARRHSSVLLHEQLFDATPDAAQHPEDEATV